MIEQLHMVTQWFAARIAVKSERGATALEYGIMLSLIAAAIIVAVFFLGDETRRNFQCPRVRTC